MTISGIYKIINKLDGKYYVGSSRDILGQCGRKYHHFYNLQKNKHPNIHLQRAYNRDGAEAFYFTVVEEVEESLLVEVEQRYLDEAKLEPNKVYNISFAAYRIEMNQEVRESIGRAHTERLKQKENHHMFNKHHSQPTKDKISRSLIGKMSGENHPFYGRKLPEHIQKSLLECCRKGQSNGRYNKTTYEMFNTVTGEYFIGTQYEFYTKFSFARDCIRNLINRKCKTINKEWIMKSIIS